MIFAALATGAAIVTAMSAVYLDINAKMSRELRTFGANFYIGPGNDMAFSEQQFQEISNTLPQALINAASPVNYGLIEAGRAEKFMVMGVLFDSLKALMPYWQVQGSWIGINFDNRNAMIGIKLATRLQVKVGDNITLFDDERKHRLQIKGIIESGDAADNMLIVSLDLAQKWLNSTGSINSALLNISNDFGQADAVVIDLRRQYPDLEFRLIRQISVAEGEVVNKINVLIGTVSAIILILSSLCVNTTLAAMVEERVYEFALQKALGAGKRAIICQVLTETIVIVFAAVLSGIVLGYFLAQVLGQAVFGAEITLRVSVLPLTLFLLLVVAIVATIIPVWRAVHIEPASILKGE